MLKPLEETELFSLFAGRFGQDYSLLVEIDRDKPLIPQLVADYKQQCSALELGIVIDELTALIRSEYSEEKLRDEIFDELVIELSMENLGLTHREFLLEVLNILKRHGREDGHTSNKKPKQPQPTQDDLSYFKPYVYPPKPDHIIPTGIEGLLTVYFAPDYDELVKQYGSRRLITNVVAQYKEDQHPAYVRDCLNEVSSLVAHKRDEKYLRDKIVNEYGVKILISKLGGSYQIFLERLHEELLGKRIYT